MATRTTSPSASLLAGAPVAAPRPPAPPLAAPSCEEAEEEEERRRAERSLPTSWSGAVDSSLSTAPPIASSITEKTLRRFVQIASATHHGRRRICSATYTTSPSCSRSMRDAPGIAPKARSTGAHQSCSSCHRCGEEVISPPRRLIEISGSGGVNLAEPPPVAPSEEDDGPVVPPLGAGGCSLAIELGRTGAGELERCAAEDEPPAPPAPPASAVGGGGAKMTSRSAGLAAASARASASLSSLSPPTPKRASSWFRLCS